MTEAIRTERQSPHVVIVTLARESKLNSMTTAMWTELADTFNTLNVDDSVRCVVLRGEGERAFCVGADIGEFAEHRGSAASAKAYDQNPHRAFKAIEACRHPVISAISGACAGGGLVLAAVTDMRIAGQSARFGLPIKRLGLVASYDEIVTLLQLVNPAALSELLFEGQMVSAEDALRMGLINRIAPDSQVFAESLATAERIAAGAPLAVRWHKKFIRRVATDASEIGPAERNEVYDCFDTEDYRIGFQSFLNKSVPIFKGS